MGGKTRSPFHPTCINSISSYARAYTHTHVYIYIYYARVYVHGVTLFVSAHRFIRIIIFRNITTVRSSVRQMYFAEFVSPPPAPYDTRTVSKPERRANDVIINWSTKLPVEKYVGKTFRIYIKNIVVAFFKRSKHDVSIATRM